MEAALEKKREAILERILEIPAMPAAVGDLISTTRNPDVAFEKLIEALQHDQGLTANILRWANSSYFSGRFQIETIRDAAVRLGLEKMKLVVMASVAAPMVKQAVSGYDLPAGSLMEHSIAVAIGTAELAEALEIKAPSYAFTAGLLHDIGKVVLGTFVATAAEPIKQIAGEEDVSFDEAERRVLGIDHAEAGAIVLQHWNIPKTIVETVRWHHEPHKYDGDKSAIDLVHTACILSMKCGLGIGSDGLNYKYSEEVASRMTLTPTQTESIAYRVSKRITEVRELFSEVQKPV